MFYGLICTQDNARNQEKVKTRMQVETANILTSTHHVLQIRRKSLP